jgi:1-acyl-sn-glycerol-3-phosphate acyltransferase
MGPGYNFPLKVFFPLALSWLRLTPRNFRADALTCVSALSPAPRVDGREHIPASGRYALVFNHYYHSGFAIWWLVMTLAAALPDNPHLIMTSELTRWFPPFGRVLSRFALPRLARVYGFTSMPHMPPTPQEAAARARAVRHVLEYIEAAENPILMFAPEGRDNLPSGVLAQPPLGAGRFLGMMADKGLSILPVGGWLQADELHIRFGPVYQLDVPEKLSNDEKDHFASERVMRSIAELLPETLRGDFA